MIYTNYVCMVKISDHKYQIDESYILSKKKQIPNQMCRLISVNRKIASVKLIVLSLNLDQQTKIHDYTLTLC